MADKKKIEEMKQKLRDDDFGRITEILSPDDRQMLEDMGIMSMEDMFKAVSMMGMDVDDIIRHTLESAEDDFLNGEFMTDDDEDTGLAPDLESLYLPNRLYLDREPSHTYHLRVRLNNAPVKIWREIKVPSDITLDFLGLIIIQVMGWNGAHLYQFHHKGVRYIKTEKEEQEAELPIFTLLPSNTRSSDDTALSDVLKQKGDRMRMEYDFGDSWMHEVWVKGIEAGDPDEALFDLVGGQGACPPDDCGGVDGYADLLSVVEKKRKSRDESEMLEWFGMDGKHFNPEYFDLLRTSYALDDYIDYVTDAFDDE